MPRKIIDFSLDLFQKDILPVCSLKQFDECTLNINLKSNGEVYNATGCNAVIYISCKNDVYKQNTGITVNESTVKILLKKEMLQEHGKALAEIELKNSEGTITTTTFILDIDGKIGEGSTLPGEIEGFIALHERLIREFKEEYNNKINELKSFDREIKSQLNSISTKNIEQDTRLKDIEYANKRQDTLLGGLFNENADGRLSIEGEGNYLKLEGSKKGLVEINKVEGNTMVNIDIGGTFKKYSDTIIFRSGNANYSELMKPSTVYTLFISHIPEGANRFKYSNCEHSTVKLVPGKFVYTLTTPDTINETAKNPHIYGSNDTVFSEEDANKIQIMLFEGEFINVPNKIFSGMLSSFEDKLITQEMVDSGLEKVEDLGKYRVGIKIVGKNLFDGKWEQGYIDTNGNTSSHASNYRSVNYIDVNYITSIISNYALNICSYTKDEVFINRGTLQANTIYLLPKETRYIKVYRGSQESDLMLERATEGQNKTSPYEDYKEYKTSILLDTPLLKDDEICVQNGQLGVLCGGRKIVLDGSNDEGWVVNPTQPTGTGETHIAFRTGEISNAYNGNGSAEILSDRFKWDTDFHNKGELIKWTNSKTSNMLTIVIEKTKLATLDKKGFVTWLQTNPVKVIYKLAESCFEPLTQILPRWILDCFEDCTLHIDSNIPISSVRASYTGNVPSVYGLEKDISAIEERNIDMVATTFDMDYRLLEVEWALEDAGITGVSLTNILNINKGVKKMALRRYEQAKIMILGGEYEKETLTRQLTRYLDKKIITQQEYDELIALMEAKNLVVGE